MIVYVQHLVLSDAAKQVLSQHMSFAVQDQLHWACTVYIVLPAVNSAV